MWLAGTIQGETKFTGQPMMKATVTGAPRFKFIDILGQDQLKAYAAKPRADLESQLGRLLKKEEDAAGEAAVDQALQQQHPVELAIKHIPKCKDIKDLIRKCGEKPNCNEGENLAAQLLRLRTAAAPSIRHLPASEGSSNWPGARPRSGRPDNEAYRRAP